MKSKMLACAALAAMLRAALLSGESVWEGAGALAPEGELPVAGYYAATNSFPRNTVVDVTNLENGKTIRVTVSAGLETPGLLAALSKDAAGVIGLRGRSIGRIRMMQPADPVAFSRYNGWRNSGGDSAGEGDAAAAPADAGAAVPAATAEAPAPDTVSRTPASVSGGAAAASAGEGSVPPQTGNTGSVVPAYALEPEWEEDLHKGIADVPEVLSPPVPASVVTRQPVQAAAAEPQWRSHAAAENTDVRGGVYLPTEQTAQAPAGDVQYRLAPSEERPPEASSRHVLSPEDFVPPLDSAPSAGGKPLYNENYTYTPPSSASSLPEPSYSLVPEPETVTPPAPASAGEFSPFAVPLIGRMERGKNYVQLGAYSKPEVVEDEIVRIGISYPLAVQNIGTDEKPLFRLLLGPLTPGESGALLQRFRSIGYKDAFVRKN
jgi:hypothetical protein